MEKLCERIYTLRKKAGMSQEELAHRTGVSRQTVSKWESGAMVPESSNLRALCVLFEVSADFLLFGEEKFAAKDEQRTQERQKSRNWSFCCNRNTADAKRTGKICATGLRCTSAAAFLCAR